MKRLWHSPTLRSAFVHGISGVGFAAANVILARVLSAADYALFTLVVALVNLGGAVAPAGVDEIVKRHRLEIGPRLLRQVIGVATGAGIPGAAGSGIAGAVGAAVAHRVAGHAPFAPGCHRIVAGGPTHR